MPNFSNHCKKDASLGIGFFGSPFFFLGETRSGERTFARAEQGKMASGHGQFRSGYQGNASWYAHSALHSKRTLRRLVVLVDQQTFDRSFVGSVGWIFEKLGNRVFQKTNGDSVLHTSKSNVLSAFGLRGEKLPRSIRW